MPSLADESIRRDILSIMSETIIALKQEHYTALREISNHTIHNASIFQDQDSLSIAVVLFAIFKIMERCAGEEYAVKRKLLPLFKKARQHLEEKNVAAYRSIIKRLFRVIGSLDNRFAIFIEEVISQAQVKKGSKLVEHGLSIGRAAELLGISQWALMSYVGKTSIVDREKMPVNILERLQAARMIFGLQKS